METLYYRKIAEIVLRDEKDAMLRQIAERVIATPREGKANITKSDRRAMKAWMIAWCDRIAGERIAAVDIDAAKTMTKPRSR